MAYVIDAENGAEATSVDVTLDTGSTANRKAILVGATENTSGGSNAGSASRDPAGTPDAMTRIAGASGSVFESGVGWWYSEMFYLDLSVTGSQTFRYTGGTGTARIVAAVLVWDGLASGAPEAAEFTTDNTDPASPLSDSITTLTNGSVIVVNIGTDLIAAPNWTWDNGETEFVDQDIVDRVAQAAAYLVKATAGAQTIGATASTAPDVAAMGSAAFAPAAAATTTGRLINGGLINNGLIGFGRLIHL
jgi:hypothetical protein